MEQNNEQKFIPLYDEILQLSDLTPNDKIILSLIYSFTKVGECFASNEYISERTGIPKRSVERIIAKLEKKHYLFFHLSMYTDEKGKVKNNKRQLWTYKDDVPDYARMSTPCTHRCVYPIRTDEYHIKKNDYKEELERNDNYITFFSKAEKSQSDDLDFNIIERQIRKYCEENDCEEYIDNLIGTFRYFYEDYERCFGKDHTILSQKNIDKTCDELIAFAYSTLGIYNLHDYKVMIYHYLRTDYKKAINYSILHFTTEGIMKNLYYKYIYQGENAILPFC